MVLFLVIAGQCYHERKGNINKLTFHSLGSSNSNSGDSSSSPTPKSSSPFIPSALRASSLFCSSSTSSSYCSKERLFIVRRTCARYAAPACKSLRWTTARYHQRPIFVQMETIESICHVAFQFVDGGHLREVDFAGGAGSIQFGGNAGRTVGQAMVQAITRTGVGHAFCLLCARRREVMHGHVRQSDFQTVLLYTTIITVLSNCSQSLGSEGQPYTTEHISFLFVPS